MTKAEPKFDPTIRPTNRGFMRADWEDTYGPASLQESSAVDPHLWLGLNDHRMHLDPAQVQWLARALNRWLRTGSLA